MDLVHSFQLRVRYFWKLCIRSQVGKILYYTEHIQCYLLVRYIAFPLTMCILQNRQQDMYFSSISCTNSSTKSLETGKILESGEGGVSTERSTWPGVISSLYWHALVGGSLDTFRFCIVSCTCRIWTTGENGPSRRVDRSWSELGQPCAFVIFTGQLANSSIVGRRYVVCCVADATMITLADVFAFYTLLGNYDVM